MSIPAMYNNINALFNGSLIKWRGKGTINHRDNTKTFAKFCKLFQVSENIGWIAWGFTV